MTKYAVETLNLTSSGKVSKDHIGHKVIASVFWDREGALMIDNLKQGKNVTGEYFAELVRKLHCMKQSKNVPMQQCTSSHLPSLLYMSAASNSSLNHLIIQIWLYRISSCLDI